MAQKKISELPFANSIDNDDIIPIVQDGVTKQIEYGDFKLKMVEEVQYQALQEMNLLSNRFNLLINALKQNGCLSAKYNPDTGEDYFTGTGDNTGTSGGIA